MFLKGKAPVISPDENMEAGGSWFLHSLHSDDVSLFAPLWEGSSLYAAGWFDSLAGKWLQPFLAELEFSLNSAWGSGFIDFYLDGESWLHVLSTHQWHQCWCCANMRCVELKINPQYIVASLPFTLHSQTWTIFQILFTHNWCVEFWAAPKETDGPFRLHDEAGHDGVIKLYHFNFNQLLGLLVQKSVGSQRLNLGWNMVWWTGTELWLLALVKWAPWKYPLYIVICYVKWHQVFLFKEM